ncbi:hypothetical protein CsSME_00028060 [Camellia sinensis var. sinensis]
MENIWAHLGGQLVRVALGLAIFIVGLGRGQGRGKVLAPALDVVPARGRGCYDGDRGVDGDAFCVLVMVEKGIVVLPIPERAIVPYYLSPGVEQVPRAYVEACYRMMVGLVEMV